MVKLAELVFACYVYSGMTDFDDLYDRFRDETEPQLDLKLKKHRQSMLTWLNAWGCRQFAKEWHHLAAEELLQWYSETNWQLLPIPAECSL